MAAGSSIWGRWESEPAARRAKSLIYESIQSNTIQNTTSMSATLRAGGLRNRRRRARAA